MLINENRSQTWSETDSFTIERYKQFSKWISNDDRVLDIGCNTGRGGCTLKEENPNIGLHGVDLVQERVEKIPKGIYESTQVCSVEECTFPNEFFNVIVAGEIIEHLPTEVMHAVLDACRNKLVVGGKLILTTPNPNSLMVKLGRRAVFNDPSHVNILSHQQLKEIAIRHQFRIKCVMGSGKAIRYVSASLPFMFVFGSYLMVLEK
jgi:2-polyprenyl-3-methyl-5-hydroxy-6-metoxy-1,4-benzoquinol methylase